MATLQAPPGRGRLGVETVAGRSVVVERLAASPLRLLSPRNHGHAAWAYTSTFGGGLVDGDELRLDVRVGPGAAAVVATQASTKIYRSPRGTAQTIAADVGAGGLLVLLSDPLVPFAGSRYEGLVDVTLAEGATVVVVDALAAGRVATGERWDFARVALRLRVAGPEGLLLDDGLVLDAAHGPLGARMGAYDAWGTLLLLGPGVAAAAGAVLARPRDAHRVGSGELESAAPVADGCLLRLAAASTAALAGRLADELAWLPDLLGDDPLARRW